MWILNTPSQLLLSFFVSFLRMNISNFIKDWGCIRRDFQWNTEILSSINMNHLYNYSLQPRRKRLQFLFIYTLKLLNTCKRLIIMFYWLKLLTFISTIWCVFLLKPFLMSIWKTLSRKINLTFSKSCFKM